jgi:RNA polymerase sigma-70 factor, ECF subfamily
MSTVPTSVPRTELAQRAILTRSVREWMAGDDRAGDATMEALTRELSQIAARILSRQAPGHTLQATALVNELWMRVSSSEASDRHTREEFIGLAVTIMRSIVIDHARRKCADKRTPEGNRIDLDHVRSTLEDRYGIGLVELGDAMEVLGAEDPDLLRVIELRFFGGLSVDEVARLLGWPIGRVRSEEMLARKRLARLLS